MVWSPATVDGRHMQNDLGSDVIDLTGPAARHPAPGRWRTRLAIGLALTFIVACAGLTLSYRHAHRNVWTKDQAPWQGFDVSSDGRTLTFQAVGIGDCTKVSGVDFSADPTAGGAVTAVVETETQTTRDGHPVFCTLALSLNAASYSVTLDRPVPDGTIIMDGSSSEHASSWLTCGRRATQVVRAPTSVGSAVRGCTAEG
jgi:hypothetical protein